MDFEKSSSAEPLVNSEGTHYEQHGDTPLQFGGYVSVYTCCVKSSDECSVGVTFDSGGVSLTVRLNADGVQRLLEVMTRAIDKAGKVDTHIRRLGYVDKYIAKSVKVDAHIRCLSEQTPAGAEK